MTHSADRGGTGGGESGRSGGSPPPGTAGTNYWSIPETKTAAAYANIDTFCMKCHDSNGANGIAMNTTGDGLQIATGPTNKQKPFNDNMTNGYDQVARTIVVNVFDQFATTNASHHAVRGRKYSTGGTQYLKVASTLTSHLGVRIVTVPSGAGGAADPDRIAASLDSETAALVIQQPNFLGRLEEVEAMAEAAIRANDQARGFVVDSAGRVTVTGTSRTAQFSPNGLYIVTASSQDRTVRLWKAQSGRQVAVLASLEDKANRPVFTRAAFDRAGLAFDPMPEI